MNITESHLRLAKSQLDNALRGVQFAGLPVDLATVLRTERITLSASEGRSGTHGLAERGPHGYRIVVFGKGEPLLDGRLRFTVAHEIAHCIIDRAVGVSPTTKSEYWKLEEICNEYAARLLMPDVVMAADARLSSLDLLRTTKRLSDSARVSPVAAGRRLAEWQSDRVEPVVIAGLVGRFPQKPGSAPAIAKVAWSGGSKLFNLGTNRLIRPGDFESRVVSAAFEEGGMPTSWAMAGAMGKLRDHQLGLLSLGLTQVGLAMRRDD
ncbi:ImmA/IrrE family metallo-endopeptidase [Herbiconiux liangxiaofengii]|uniref:ImmA/IrrE family metallo-endopeptidase n=1 Tax=Herbiconiux liangxiaofengii TaxID=3342795 RepID=UPI0035B8982D